MNGSDHRVTILTKSLCNIGDEIKAKALEIGFDACGFAAATQVDDEAVAQYDRWIASGAYDCMQWALNHREIRNNPCLLLQDAKTVISLAANYYPQRFQRRNTPQFAYYAYGTDYHEVLRAKMAQLAHYIETATGCTSRCCVDSAPIRERYWAQRAGLGFIGLNNMLIIPGQGSYFFLCEIVTTLELPPDAPCKLSCDACRACVNNCPSGALTGDCAADARECLSCQTIERKGELKPSTENVIGNHVYGCDECQLCCPHNKNATAGHFDEFQPSETFLNLTADDIMTMTDDGFRQIFRHSAVKRAKLAGLQRNCKAVMKSKS